VALYDVLGREKRLISDFRAMAGIYDPMEIYIDGISSGLYIVRIEGSNFEATQKIFILE
jgi:hypothetical protein